MRLSGVLEMEDAVCWGSTEDPAAWVRPTKGNVRHFRARDRAGKQTSLSGEKAGIRKSVREAGDTIARLGCEVPYSKH